MAQPACNPPDATKSETQSEYRIMKIVEICIVPEEEGGFSAFVPSLIGVCSQGDTDVEAFENCEEALRAALDAYREAHKPVPWLNDPAPQDPKIRSMWVQVDVERAA